VTEPACYRVGLEHYPGINPFVLDRRVEDSRVEDSRPRLSRQASSTFLNALIESNRRWGLDVADEVRVWTTGETLTIIAGQQVGFAGGPLYTIAKLASMLKMKRDNEARGVKTTVFFWLATEDHDWDEVAGIALPNRDAKRARDLTYLHAPHFEERKPPVGPLPIPEALIAQFVAVLGIERPSWLRAGITFGDSFAELLAIAVKEKFILVDALLPELRIEGAPVIEKILARWDDVQQSIEAKSEELQKRGYAPQVTPRPGESYTLLFRIEPDGNRELVRDPAEAGPLESISMSALTRPLLQDFVFRPDVFVGGPAEVAYFAQIEGVHEILDVPMPRVALRAHELVAPRGILRRFSKYGVRPEDVFRSPDALVALHESRAVAEVQSIASEANRQLEEHIAKIRELALPADHAVARSINRSIGHINYHFRKLTERAIRGFIRKDRERYDAARELVSTFYPDNHVQDRIVAWVPFWLRYGSEFIEKLIAEAEPDAAVFKIVGL
jgi:uncharacterized protein YllA (UPF0747 family)